MLKKINETVDFLRSRITVDPEYGIILGTGLGGLIQEIEVLQTLSYDEIPNFPVSTVESHKGKLVIGILNGKTVIVMQGRFHYYEGYNMQEITFPVRVMKLLGIKALFVSNACGSVNPEIRTGDLMIIKDHINLLPENPLRGENIHELGPRFPDMSEPYSQKFINKGLEIAKNHNIPIHVGVYVSVQGPNLETAAEYRYLRTIGADVVGMSTIPEILVARHMLLPCFAISVITDEGFNEPLQPVTIEDVIAAAHSAEPRMTKIFEELIGSL